MYANHALEDDDTRPRNRSHVTRSSQTSNDLAQSLTKAAGVSPWKNSVRCQRENNETAPAAQSVKQWEQQCLRICDCDGPFTTASRTQVIAWYWTAFPSYERSGKFIISVQCKHFKTDPQTNMLIKSEFVQVTETHHSSAQCLCSKCHVNVFWVGIKTDKQNTRPSQMRMFLAFCQLRQMIHLFPPRTDDFASRHHAVLRHFLPPLLELHWKKGHLKGKPHQSTSLHVSDDQACVAQVKTDGCCWTSPPLLADRPETSENWRAKFSDSILWDKGGTLQWYPQKVFPETSPWRKTSPTLPQFCWGKFSTTC